MLTTAERGYGGRHQALRRELAPIVAAGGVPCSRCGREIERWEAWDLDHTDDRLAYAGAAHASCNRSAGARARNTRMSDEQRAVAWARQYEADVARLERERQAAQRAAPRPAIY